ncbi:MAG: BrnA antitoxin family protein [Porticoccus sp.]
MSRKPLTDKSGEVRELEAEDFKTMKPVSEVLPDLVELQRRSRGRPKSDNPKQQVTVRLDSEVVDYFRGGGRGWQTRLNEALKEYMASHG